MLQQVELCYHVTNITLSFYFSKTVPSLSMELANDGANEQSQDSKTINFLIRLQMNQFKCKFNFEK